ncbi:Uncharacterized protein YebE, UPF0316 family [Caminicella sporogenes DSM 14501]|uniref:UPF0316 protein SAMN02745883_00982 n=1 Tax=Caminicella sporogenes DSM 14501 TaxID=1121266 RepID=A0A1M6NVJ1_9FIRM|nr:DUF2179 domain-containing protein [Caminicella sporogenes]RKD21634.1 hypothetical protein BET04_07935 [Caminicella sporogenes]WIF94077.1 DUF2179 domain-containing protein [Caminicella sporogenes]SHJ99658.1 Uncharacterized protein YebE, UPF0316 family [Caminicella sporogenes DSM 14501]
MILNYFFIFSARVLDMTSSTLRMLMLVRGKRLYAAILGFFEVIIYVTALGKVVNGLSDYRNLLSYALGFACGNFVGSYIEEKIAIGQITAQIICSNKNGNYLARLLRTNGFGVTAVEGEGKEGKRYVLNVMLDRKNIKKLYDIVDEMEEKPFVTVFDIKSMRGGYFTKTKRK